MTDRAPAPADVEAIAEVMCHEYHPMHWDVAYGNRTKPCQACKIHAAALLTSPALATLRAHERAEALREAAGELAQPVPRPAYTGAAQQLAIVADWLRDRADRQERQ